MAWVFAWKVFDVAATLILASKYGWTIEGNPFVRILSPVVDPAVVTLGTIFYGAFLAWILYGRVPFAVEGLGIVIPVVTVGNFLQVAGMIAGTVLNLAVFPVLILAYYLHDWKLFFFDAQLGEISFQLSQ